MDCSLPGPFTHRTFQAKILESVEAEELKSLLMKVKKESEKADFKFIIQKTKIMAFSPINSW